jgi:hypothetical protein
VLRSRASLSAKRTFGVGALSVLSLAAPLELQAQSNADQCVQAYEDGQQARKRGELKKAAEAFTVCAAESCPDLTKTDCVQWLGEVEAQRPTVVLALVDENGKDVANARVFVDGELHAESLDGKALALDPGPHKVRIVVLGKPEVSEELVVREGDKLRKVELKLGAAGEGSALGSISPITWVLAGVGGASLVTFATVGGLGLAGRSCAPTCTDDEVAAIETKFIVADVFLAVGLTSLAAGLVVGLVSATSESQAQAALLIHGGPGSLALGLDVSF